MNVLKQQATLKADVIGNIMIKVTEKRNCTGCASCSNACPKQCIAMVPDEEGFLYPKVDVADCVDCGLCEKVCPILNQDEYDSPICILGLKNKNEESLLQSASGGVFIELAHKVAHCGGYVAGAVWNDDMLVEHKIVHTISDCKSFQGSKYVQSNIGVVYREIKKLLRNGEKVLFSGTPCQVAGLKHFLRKDYDNLITIDIICHGVPSPYVFKEYIKHIERVSKKKITGINMRDKSNGWGMFIRIYFSDGTSICHTRDTCLFNGMYAVHYATRPSCHHCRFASMHRVGDITIGDFWSIKKWHPNFYDSRGVSCALVNSKKGLDLLNSVLQKFETLESSPEEVMQNNLYQSASPSSYRTEFMKSFMSEGYETTIRKYLDYGTCNIMKFYLRKILRKFHLPIPSIIQSNIRK